MNDFLGCLIYLALIGVIFFIVGRALPKEKISLLFPSDRTRG